jgi:hypothetical protein
MVLLRTVGVLALRCLVGSCPALVRARLPLFGLFRGIRWQISGGICLCADAQQGEGQDHEDGERCHCVGGDVGSDLKGVEGGERTQTAQHSVDDIQIA